MVGNISSIKCTQGQRTAREKSTRPYLERNSLGVLWLSLLIWQFSCPVLIKTQLSTGRYSLPACSLGHQSGNFAVMIYNQVFSVSQQVQGNWSHVNYNLQILPRRTLKLLLQQLHRKRSELGMGKIHPPAGESAPGLISLALLFIPAFTVFTIGQDLISCNHSKSKSDSADTSPY